MLGTLAIWEVASRLEWLPRRSLPPISEVLTWLIRELGSTELYVAVGRTLLHWGGGLILGAAVGLLLGLVMGLSRNLEQLLITPSEFLRPVPSVIYLPLVLLLLGVTTEMVVLLVAVSVVWPVLFQAYYGARGVDSLLDDVGSAYGLSRRQRLFSVILPQVSPFVGTGVRLASSIALVVAVALEMISGVAGTGRALRSLQLAGISEGVYGYVVVLGALGYALNELFQFAEKRVLWWHRPYRRS
ncbi:ABC transporter permease [Egicoccus sp. AB-alg2]|uniref:ABC transporter permease n=1 Tax=Egicoccus sp. AB-alg2 TaxID=3242693 RepID=UPI00359D56E7